MKIRIGHGFDVHRLIPGRELWLGGLHIEYDKGLDGHSDADVLIHAICDALLGALALGDIGTHFPDTEAKYKNIDSKKLLAEVTSLLLSKGWKLSNLDATIVAQQPLLSAYIPKMRKLLCEILEVDLDDISIKATTTEKLGPEGRGEGISAHAVVLIAKE